MCFKSPSIETSAVEVSAADLVPNTTASEPEAPEVGGTKDSFNQKKGRKQLTIQKDTGYNPVNY